MSDQPNLGPSRETLKHLHSMLPSAAAGIAQKKIAKNRPVVTNKNDLSPSKVCEVCSALFGFIHKYDGDLQSSVCHKCQKQLDQSLTAFVSVDRYAFGKSELLKDMAGKIVHVQEESMNEIQKQFKMQHRRDVNVDNN